MKPDYSEGELLVIGDMEKYFEAKGSRACAEAYYCLSRSVADARRFIERNNLSMARRVVQEGCELVEDLYSDMETGENSN